MGTMKRTLRVLLLAGASLSISSGFLFGQERSASLPSVDVPTKLEPYADLALVEKNARKAIELLATAQMTLGTYPAPVNDKGPKQITPECDKAEVRSFNRGYLLAHAGFNIFLSLQELGIPRIEGPYGLPAETKRNFVQFGRAALLNVWTPSRLKDLLKVRQALKDLPQPIKQDLAAFLSKLLEYRTHYNRLKKARGETIDDLFLREGDGYYWYAAYWIDQTKVPKRPKGIGYDKLSELLDEHARQVSDVAKADPGRCFVAHYGPTITFPSEKLKYDATWIYPTKYLVSFWRRRDMEGTSSIAAYVIAQVLETLRKD